MLSIEQFSRSDMARPDGLSYLEFSKTLAPHYTRVWCQIVAGFCALGCIILLCIIRDNGGDLSSLPLTVAIAAPLIGYTLHYLMLFFHEAAHFNIASDRKRNDRLADLVIGSLLGQSIKDYRAVHLLHHKYTESDSCPSQGNEAACPALGSTYQRAAALAGDIGHCTA